MELNNLSESRNIIEGIEKESIAEELEIEKGDLLLSINGKIVKDIIDYKYLAADDYILLKIKKPNSDIWEYEIEKDFDEELGIIFTNPLIDRAKSCSNKCIFCFIDQLPPNMRETLYFKDDDSRLSFLQGNFITLTNMSDDEIDRIISYRLSPINISIHTTNPELRIKMLNNKKAGKIFEILKRFHEARLEVNCQIVLIPGINDGEELERTLEDLSSLYPTVKSIAVVPVGISKYRDDLVQLTPFNKELSRKLIEKIIKLQNNFLKQLGTRFIFPSDEFFALSKIEIPSYEEYEGFPQLENGVGLMKSFENEIREELKINSSPVDLNKKFIVATGTLAFDFMDKLSKEIMEKFKGLKIEVISIKNNFFGDKITVSGLITASDLISQLKDVEADCIIIPESMMKSGEKIFLDDISLKDAEKELNKKLVVSKVEGKEFIKIFNMEVM